MIRASSIFRITAPPRTPCDACAPFGVGKLDAQGNGVSPHFARYLCTFYVRVGVAVGRGRVHKRLALVKYGSCERGEQSISDALVRAATLHSAGARA